MRAVQTEHRDRIIPRHKSFFLNTMQCADQDPTIHRGWHCFSELPPGQQHLQSHLFIWRVLGSSSHDAVPLMALCSWSWPLNRSNLWSTSTHQSVREFTSPECPEKGTSSWTWESVIAHWISGAAHRNLFELPSSSPHVLPQGHGVGRRAGMLL